METDSKTPSETTMLPIAESNVNLPAIDGRTAVLYSDPEAVASAIKKKIDKDLDGLKPNPPHFIQKVLRLAAYPAGVISGLVFAHREARDGVEKYLTEGNRFEGMKNQAGATKKESTGRQRLKEHKIELSNNNAEKAEIIRDFLGMDERPTSFVKKLGYDLVEAKRTIELASVDPARKARVIFNGLFATTAAISLLLTLSDNKNFLQFGKDSNLDKDVSLDR